MLNSVKAPKRHKAPLEGIFVASCGFLKERFAEYEAYNEDRHTVHHKVPHYGTQMKEVLAEYTEKNRCYSNGVEDFGQGLFNGKQFGVFTWDYVLFAP